LDGAFGCATDASYQVVFHRDSVTELWYDSFDSMREASDGANFSELGTALALLTRETEISVLKPSADAAVKVLYFLRKMQNLSLGEYVERWTSAHE
jgi:hypothetical protein